nr:MAG TPA: Gaa1-like, GPI transamidase component [Caudoviricetes sp.]
MYKSEKYHQSFFHVILPLVRRIVLAKLTPFRIWGL